MTTYKCLSSGDGGNVAAGKKRTVVEKPTETAEPASQLGALKLDADEITAFEKWMTEPSKPTDLVLEAARTHKVLRLKQAR
jgi:hypothetical protein